MTKQLTNTAAVGRFPLKVLFSGQFLKTMIVADWSQIGLN